MRRSSAKRSLMPPLTMSLSSITPSARAPSATTSGVAPCARDGLDLALQLRRQRTALRLSATAPIASAAPLRISPAFEVDAAHARLRAEGDELRAERLHVAPADAVLLLGEHDDRAAFGRLVGQRGQLRRVGQAQQC